MNKFISFLSVTKILIIITFFIITHNALGQSQDFALTNMSLKDIIPPGPMAYELTRFEVQQPDLYTGTANVNIPLYTINFDGWQLPLSLSYHASGIMTNQEATEVGLGWALNTTAVITRQVNGGNDLFNDTYQIGYKGYVYSDVNTLNNLNNYRNISDTERMVIRDKLTYKRIDTEPDEFRYNFFGYSGSFNLSIKQQTNNKIEVIKHQVNGVKIEFDEIAKNFKVTTPDGFVGYFTIKERTTNVSGTDMGSGVGMSLKIVGDKFDVQEIIHSGKFRVVTGWYLEKIVSPTGKEMVFKYNIGPDESSFFISTTQVAFGENMGHRILPIFPTGGVLYPNVQFNGPPYPGFSRQIVEHVYQESITIPNELSINFSMEDRQDLEPNTMVKLAFYAQSPELYFYNPNNPNEHPNYNSSEALNANQPLPKRYTALTINGLDASSTLHKTIHFRQSYFNEGSQGNALYSIYQYLRSKLDAIVIDDQTYRFYYATGLGLPVKSTLGVDHFGYYNGKHYENYNAGGLKHVLHGYSLQNSNGYPIGEIINTDLFNALPRSFFYVQEQNRKPNKDFAIGGSLVKVEYPTKGYSLYNYELHDYHANGKSSENLRLVPEAINTNGDAGKVMAGGLRIASIEHRDENNELISKKSYEYVNAFNQSSGKLMTPMLYFQNYPDDGAAIFMIEQTTNGSGLVVNSEKVFHYNLTIPGSNTAGGKKIGYSRVTEKVLNVKTNETYKTVYDFENTPVNFLTDDTKPYILVHDLNGKPNSQKHFDSDNDLKRVINYQKTHNTKSDFVAAIRYSSLIYTFDNIQEYQGAGILNGLYFIPLINYKKPIETINISEKKTIEYGDSGQVENTVNYDFNNNNQNTLVQSKNSKNETLRKVAKHLSDYIDTDCVYSLNQPSQCIQEYMVDKNLINPVLEEIIYENNKVIQAHGYRYDIEQDNLVLKEIFNYNRSLGDFTPSINGFEFSGSYESRVTFDIYDEEGNLLQQTLKDGTKTSYIWGYDKKYPIVEGKNISYTDLLAAHNASQGSNYEEAIRSHALTANAMITTYKYNPLVGMTELENENGLATHYDYGILNRLKDIKDNDNNIVKEFQYNYKNTNSPGSLIIPNLSFGVIIPGVSITKYLPITNMGNTPVTITRVTLPQYFSTTITPNNFTIEPHQTFDYPVVLNSPDTMVNINVSAAFQTNYGGSYSVNLTAKTDESAKPELVITGDCYALNTPQNCFLLTQSFSSKIIAIRNTGTAPLYIYNVTSDDSCVVSEWQNPQYVNGRLVPRKILPGQCSSFTVSLNCSLTYGNGNNWDTVTDLIVRTYNPQTNTTAFGKRIYLRKYPSQCN